MPRSCPAKEDAAIFKGMGLAIAEVRGARGLSKSALAAKAGISPSALGQIEFGNADAKWGTLRRLASAMEIPLDVLAEMAEELALGIGPPAPHQQSGCRMMPAGGQSQEIVARHLAA